MQKQIELLFNGKNEILHIIDENSSIVKYLGLPNDKCGLVDTVIKEGKLLGEGQYGAAYEITIPGMGSKKYAMKRTNIILPFYTRDTKDEILQMLEESELTFDDIKPLQLNQEHIDYFENADGNQAVRVVMPPSICKLREDISFDTFPGKLDFLGYPKQTTFPKGSYLCADESFAEHVIGVYLGKFYRENECINFFDTHAMLTCNSNTKNVGKDQDGMDALQLNQYIFMDKIDGDFAGDAHKGKIGQNECVKKALYRNIGRENERNYAMDAVYVQTIFAIAFYQEKLQLSHNDLHTGNLFIEYVTADTKFNNGYVAGADYYHYNHYGTDLFFPAVPMLAKIGDFGLSFKYSSPMIGNKDIAEGFMYNNVEYFSNVFKPSYDSLYFTGAYCRNISDSNGGNGFVFPSELSPLLVKCLDFISGGVVNPAKAKLNGYLTEFTTKGLVYNDWRPILQNLDSVKTARELLEGPIAEYYKNIQPDNGKIVTLGVL